MVVSYLGTPYLGWQLQARGATVQGELEKVLTGLLQGPRVVVVGTARTDAGVHAAGQVAHFDLPVAIPVAGLYKSLNARLPESIRVHRLDPVPRSFHAQHCARAKRYTYRVRWLESPTAAPWTVARTALLRRPRDLDSIARACDTLVGTHDWASFSVKYPIEIKSRRNLAAAEVRPGRSGLVFNFTGEGFLRYQVRRMVGALLEVGWGRRDLDGFAKLMAHPVPGQSVLTAPARGLTLEKVYLRRPAAGGAESKSAVIHSESSRKE